MITRCCLGGGETVHSVLCVRVVAAADVSDHEQDPIKLSSLPPGRVDLDGTAVQITCGLQHTGLCGLRLLSTYRSVWARVTVNIQVCVG